MKAGRFLTLLFLLSISVSGQSPNKRQTQAAIQAAQEEHFQIRRQNFDSGRQLLLDKGVPFDPDELLRDNWSQNLKATLDSMPEMRQARRETGPLKGAYLADTLYLPEHVQLSGHTIIVVNYLVFEGKNVVVKGPFDLHVLPANPIAVLGTTLAETLREKPELLNVKHAGKPALPSFRLLKNVVQTESHHITFDTSGREPEWRRNPPQKRSPNLRRTSWSGFIPFQSGNQNVSGNPGATGQNGAPGVPGAPGETPPKAPNGSCTGDINGAMGTAAPQGGAATRGGNGFPGGTGQSAGIINV